MKKLFSICLLTIAFGGQLCAQQISQVEPPRFAVKWSPLHMIYFYPSAQVAVEHRLFKRLNVQYDFGLVIDYPYADSEDFRDKEGYRLTGEVRYYVPSPPKIPFYLATEYYYSDIRFTRSQVIGHGCESGDCNYFQYTDYKVEHTNQGMGLKFGILLFPGWNKNRSFFFDINAGGAYRNIVYTEIGKPAGTGIVVYDNDDSTIFTPSERSRDEFRLILGIRLCYRFL
jgi:hypothetical protein